MRCLEKSSVTKRSEIGNSLTRNTTPASNTLTAFTFSLKFQMGALRYLVPTCSIYYSCVYSVSISEVLLLGLSAGGLYEE